MRVLITGCGRSGTAYAARVMQYLGLDVGHEREGVDGISDWHAVGLTDWPKFDIRVHLWRPWREWIGSFLTVSKDSWRFIHEAQDTAPTGSKIADCLIHWYKWNTKARRLCDVSVSLDKLTVASGFVGGPVTKVNAREHRNPSLKEIKDSAMPWSQVLVFMCNQLESNLRG